MKKELIIIFFIGAIGISLELKAQYPLQGQWVTMGEDTLYLLKTVDIMVDKKTGKIVRKEDTKKYKDMLRRVRKVYPIAQTAAKLLDECEEELSKCKTEAEQKKVMRKIEKQLIKEHGSTLRGLYVSEGNVLLKLVDRETGSSSYDFLKEMRGSFAAVMWQGVAQLFDHDLKEKFDPLNNEDDRTIEEIVTKIERGEL